MGLIDKIYEAIGDDDAYRALPAVLAAAGNGRSCTIFRLDPSLILREAIAFGLPQEMLDFQLSDDIKAIDVWTKYAAQRPLNGRVLNTDDIWDQASFMRTPYFNEYFRSFGDDTTRCVGGVSPSQGGYVSFGVQRGMTWPRFEDSDAEGLREHAAHLFRALDLRARLRESDAKGELLQRTLDQLFDAVFVVDASGRIVATNTRGEQILALADGLRVCAGRLACVDPRGQARLDQAVQGAASWSGSHGDAMRIERVEGAAPYRVLVSPIAAYRPVALVIVEDPAASDPGLPATLARLYGLTDAEAALAGLLADGQSPEEAAIARDVRLSTVRSQIQSLLSKTHARRLTDLARLLARAPRRAPRGGTFAR